MNLFSVRLPIRCCCVITHRLPGGLRWGLVWHDWGCNRIRCPASGVVDAAEEVAAPTGAALHYKWNATLGAKGRWAGFQVRGVGHPVRLRILRSQLDNELRQVNSVIEEQLRAALDAITDMVTAAAGGPGAAMSLFVRRHLAELAKNRSAPPVPVTQASRQRRFDIALRDIDASLAAVPEIEFGSPICQLASSNSMPQSVNRLTSRPNPSTPSATTGSIPTKPAVEPPACPPAWSRHPNRIQPPINPPGHQHPF